MSATKEIVLHGDTLEAVLLPELGARLHRLRAFGHDLLRTPDDSTAHRREPFFWGAYVMAPWCNRIGPGPIAVAGRTVDLATNYDDGSAIHGQVYARPWTVDADGTVRVTGGGDGWPWPYELTCSASLDGPVLALDYRLTNRSDGPMPAGLGLHPWFRRPVALAIPASAAYPVNSASSPTSTKVSGAFDLRTSRQPAEDLDGTWTELAARHIDLSWPEPGVVARIEVAAPTVLVAVATPSRLDAVAVEPQTHGPDGLRRLSRDEPDALALLEPGGELTLGLRVTVGLARILRERRYG